MARSRLSILAGTVLVFSFWLLFAPGAVALSSDYADLNEVEQEAEVRELIKAFLHEEKPLRREAVRLDLHALADVREPHAQFFIGRQEIRSRDLALGRAQRMLEDAADAGIGAAALEIALAYHDERLHSVDRKRDFINWLNRAAELSYPKAMYVLGLYYTQGDFGLQHNLEEGWRLIELSAMRGFAEAQLSMALLLNGMLKGQKSDDPSRRDQMRAEAWLRAAAGEGLPPAIFVKAGRDLFSAPKLGENNVEKSLGLLAEGAKSGGARCIEAMLIFGYRGSNDTEPPISQNPVQAYIWLQVANDYNRRRKKFSAYRFLPYWTQTRIEIPDGDRRAIEAMLTPEAREQAEKELAKIRAEIEARRREVRVKFYPRVTEDWPEFTAPAQSQYWRAYRERLDAGKTETLDGR